MTTAKNEVFIGLGYNLKIFYLVVGEISIWGVYWGEMSKFLGCVMDNGLSQKIITKDNLYKID